MNAILQSWMSCNSHTSFRDFAIGVGSRYMQGEFTANEVQEWIIGESRVLNNGWPAQETFHETLKLVRAGTEWAIEQDMAISSRLQPEQDPETLLACSGRKLVLANGQGLVLVRRVKKTTKSSFQTVHGECLKFKDGWFDCTADYQLVA